MKLYIIITDFFLRFCFAYPPSPATPNPPALCLSFIHLSPSHSVFEYLNHRNRFGFACLLVCLLSKYNSVLLTIRVSLIGLLTAPAYVYILCTRRPPTTRRRKKEKLKKKKKKGGGGGGRRKGRTAGCQRVENILTLKSELSLCVVWAQWRILGFNREFKHQTFIYNLSIHVKHRFYCY